MICAIIGVLATCDSVLPVVLDRGPVLPFTDQGEDMFCYISHVERDGWWLGLVVWLLIL